ncbi:cyclic nucleotide-binding domain-containing protein [Oculatella sp. LEGE 06141]|uniref:cyclic nucleotide-binding domain-containing protein n=1 Tax=Oculatella sp. LEGE 06141 TaxID=1828648 RepID=UPI00187F75BB|nr:cyclic nucleotide-binding domain-containing protein [Oculatella sp. LEGE 06141]MBE9180193.1 cyclic nucleotide-binding domain-containing protein [Oculatella sp. LEGE 06141]
MAEVLLKELSNADINWMIAAGHQEEVTAGTVLVQLCKDPDMIYLLLDGMLTIVVPSAESDSTGSSLAVNNCQDREITQLSRGEIVGETSLFDLCFMPAVVRAAVNSLVLAIPRQQLVTKLEQDINFSTHLYRAIALMLSERLRQILEMPGQVRAINDQPMKEALFVFGELRDSDVDWLITVGEVKPLAPGTILIQAGRPVEALDFILDGLLLITVPEGDYNPLTLCFERQERDASFGKAIANLTRGEISGAISFLDFRPLPVTVRAVHHSLVLSISRQALTTKLQQDMGFASRFYRVLAIQLSNSLQMVMSRLGCHQNMYDRPQGMDEAVEYDDELDLDSLQQVSQGAARFNWMLKRLGVL